MLKVKYLKFSNLILLVGTIGIAKALDENKALVSTSGFVGEVNGNQTSMVNMTTPSQVEGTSNVSTNLCISTLTLSTCTCEPKEPQNMDAPVDSPKYDGDEWDRYIEMPKITSATLKPDYVLTTNFSTSSQYHRKSLERKGTTSHVVITHSTSQPNHSKASSVVSKHQTLSSIFPSIHISTAPGHYNFLTSVHRNSSFNTGYRNNSMNTGYSNISSTMHSGGLSTHISTLVHTTVNGSSCIGSGELVTTVAEIKTSTAQILISHHDASHTHELHDTSTASSEHPTSASADDIESTSPHTQTENLLVTSLISYSNLSSLVDNSDNSRAVTIPSHRTESSNTVYETSYESSNTSIITSKKTKETILPSLFLNRPATTSHQIMTTTQSEGTWSDYWDYDNWSEEWPSEIWSDGFKETSKTNTHPYWITSEIEKHLPSSIQTNTHTGKRSNNQYMSKSSMQGIVHSTHAGESSFEILPSSHIPHSPKPITSFIENTSLEQQKPKEQQTVEQHTQEQQTQEQQTQEQQTQEHTENHHTGEVQTKTLPLSESTSSISEPYENNHTSERPTQINATSKEENVMTSKFESYSKPTFESNASYLSRTEYSSQTKKPSMSGSSSAPTGTFSSNGSSTSTPSIGPSSVPKPSYYSKHSRSTTISSMPTEAVITILPKPSRTYPRKRTISPIFTLKPAPSMLSLENSRQVKRLSQTNSEEAETETIYITLLPVTELSHSTIQSSSSKQSENATIESISSVLARPWHILKPNEKAESIQEESSASNISIYYLLIVPYFTFMMVL